MSRVDRSRRYRLCGLVAIAFLVGALASPSATARPDEVSGPGVAASAAATAQAEEDAAPQPDVDQFGGFVASARANGVQLTYDSPNLLAVGSPIVQLSVPESLATLNSGPVGYGLASFAFPGPLLADLGAALAASGTETGIPSYPLRSEAFFPAGPTSASTGEGGTVMAATTEFADTRAYSSFAGFALGPVGTVGAVTTDTRSDIEGDQVYARSSVELADVSLLAGLVRIESIRTDLVATSNGAEAASSGQTTVGAVTVLGLPATIDGDGIRFTPRRAPEGSPTTPPTTSLLGGLVGSTPLGDVLDPDALLAPVIAPLNDLLDQIGAAGDEALAQLFEASGIEIKILDTVEVIDGASSTRTAGGLSITINYDGQNTPVLTDLINLIPTDQLPSDNLGPVPFSPQALVNLLKKVHIAGIALAPGNVTTTATPAFAFEVPPFEPTPIESSTPSLSPSVDFTSPSFGPAPSGTIDLAGPSSQGSAAPRSVPASSTGPAPFGLAIPAILIIAALLAGPFLGSGTMRLADNALAPVGSSCPDGLDQLPSQEASP